MKKLKMTTQKLTFSVGCEKYLEFCRQRNLRQGTINYLASLTLPQDTHCKGDTAVPRLLLSWGIVPRED